MNDFQPFVMERMMSKLEHEVDYNLSESGVHPVLLSELLDNDPKRIEALLATDLNYPHANGTPQLRENISALYIGARPENALVTVGAIEANYLALQTLLKPGDEIVIMLPNYMQIWGIAKNSGLSVKTFNLAEENGWAPDLDELDEAVTDKTKMIAVCNPNNPTGRILREEEMARIIAAADRSGAWILADEVYTGAERVTDEETPSFYSRYDKVVAVGSMSKAYGLPGLRVGWAVTTEKVVDEMWARHEYMAIAATMLSNKLTALALSPEVRPRLIARTRKYIRDGYPVLEEWMEEQRGLFSLTPPEAAAIAFVRYDLNINSTRLVNRLQNEKSVLIVPGDHFGLDQHLRISFGLPHKYLKAALERIHELVSEIKEASIG
ncbi:MAG: aminotransferase class I/II-fold pyridoxal phosphate-dependent enzyme [Pyrinomonadaceae bacterium]|nr:aminotransferase class I/II-fold pyridoxal phosphate-dependent enzyme [Pyrinomonadaceae bacterium]